MYYVTTTDGFYLETPDRVAALRAFTGKIVELVCAGKVFTIVRVIAPSGAVIAEA